MPSKKKKYNARFPPARIKKIMQTDEDVGKVAAAVPVIISRALELFIESLILKSNNMTQSRNARTLSTAHIKHIIESEKKFDFLRDLVANMADMQQNEEDGDSQSGLEGVDPPPAPPRPERAAADRPDSATASTDKPAKRPRGRPRKHRPEEEQRLPPKKRGRRKKQKEETTDDSETEDANSDGDSDETETAGSPAANSADSDEPGEGATEKQSGVPFARYEDRTSSESESGPLALTVRGSDQHCTEPARNASPLPGASPAAQRSKGRDEDASEHRGDTERYAGEPESARSRHHPPDAEVTAGNHQPGAHGSTTGTHPELPPHLAAGGLPYVPPHVGLPSAMNNCSTSGMPGAYPGGVQCPLPVPPMGAPLPPYNVPMSFYGSYPPPPTSMPAAQPRHTQPRPSTDKDNSDS